MLTKDNIEFTKTASFIFVESTDVNVGFEDDVEIDREKFEDFVDRNKKRDWSHEDTGKTMTMPWDLYYQSECAKWDILAFIEVTKACDKASELITDLLKPNV